MQHSCSHYNAFCGSMCTFMQPLPCDLHPRVAEHQGGTDYARHDPGCNRCTHKVPFIAGRSHFKRKNTWFRAPASSPTKSHATFMQPLQCILQQHVHIHAAITMRFASARCRTPRRNRFRWERPQPQPPHTQGTLHRRLQPLYTEKHKVSCSGFLPKPTPCNSHAAITLRLVLFCAVYVMCCGMYCYVMCCYAMYRYAMYCFAMYCFVMYCYVMFCCVMYCYVMYCYVVYCCVMYCYVIYCYYVLCCLVMYCYVIYCYYVLCCFVMYCHVMYCFVMYCSVVFLLCDVLLCGVLLCDVWFCDVLLCDVLLLRYTSSVTRKIASQLPLINGPFSIAMLNYQRVYTPLLLTLPFSVWRYCQDQLTNVQQVFATNRAFAALKADGRIVTWGHPGYGGDSSKVHDQLPDLKWVVMEYGWVWCRIM